MAGSLAVFLAALIQSTVVGWQVYGLTKDPMTLGYVGLFEAIPFLALTLLGGFMADRVDRRSITLAALLVVLAGGVWLFVMNLGTPREVWPFYAVQALSGVGRAFLRPASVALGTELVPADVLPNAATWRTAIFTTSAIAGPAIGGLMATVPRVAYGVMIGLLVVGIASIASVAPRPRRGGDTRFKEGLLAALRFVLSHQIILAALSLDMFGVLFGGAVAMLPAFAQDVLHVGGLGFGLLRAAPSVGAIVMSLVLAHRKPMRRAGPTLLVCVALFGSSWIAFAVSTSYALSLALLAFGGALDGLSMVVRSTHVQTLTPPHLMGRVLAVNSFFIGSSNELGAYESGLAARVLGLVRSVVFGGAMTLVTVGAVAWRAPKLRRLGSLAVPPVT
jgi:hypothetical protein